MSALGSRVTCHPMDKRLRKYYYAAVINLLLWLLLLSSTVFPQSSADPIYRDMILGSVIAGNILAALLQHWTYYDIYHPKTRFTSSADRLPKD